MISKECKRCESYLNGQCIGSYDYCFNKLSWPKRNDVGKHIFFEYGDLSCD